MWLGVIEVIVVGGRRGYCLVIVRPRRRQAVDGNSEKGWRDYLLSGSRSGSIKVGRLHKAQFM